MRPRHHGRGEDHHRLAAPHIPHDHPPRRIGSREIGGDRFDCPLLLRRQLEGERSRPGLPGAFQCRFGAEIAPLLPQPAHIIEEFRELQRLQRFGGIARPRFGQRFSVGEVDLHQHLHHPFRQPLVSQILRGDVAAHETRHDVGPQRTAVLRHHRSGGGDLLGMGHLAGTAGALDAAVVVVPLPDGELPLHIGLRAEKYGVDPVAEVVDKEGDFQGLGGTGEGFDGSIDRLVGVQLQGRLQPPVFKTRRGDERQGGHRLGTEAVELVAVGLFEGQGCHGSTLSSFRESNEKSGTVPDSTTCLFGSRWSQSRSSAQGSRGGAQ